jgi:hypothetical protein
MEAIDGTILPGGVLGSLAMAALFGAGVAKRVETNQLFILQFSPFFRNAQKGQARGLPFCGSELLYAML